MYRPSPLVAEFESMKSTVASPQARGRRLEPLAEKVFRRAHFTAERDVKSAKPRQTDLLARDSRDANLIETKWPPDRADAADTAGMFDRLQRTPSEARGIMASITGFNSDPIL